MKLFRSMALPLVATLLLCSAPAFADDDRHEREKKFVEWAREDAKRQDEWLHASHERADEDRREHAKAYREWLEDRAEHDRDDERIDEYVGRVVIGEPIHDGDHDDHDEHDDDHDDHEDHDDHDDQDHHDDDHDDDDD